MAGQKRDLNQSVPLRKKMRVKPVERKNSVNPLDMLVAACEAVDAGSEPHRPPDLAERDSGQHIFDIKTSPGTASSASSSLSESGDSGSDPEERGEDSGNLVETFSTETSIVKVEERDELLEESATNISLDLASKATSTFLDVKSFGHLDLNVEEYQFCRYSKYTGWHLQRGCGDMTIHLSSSSLPFPERSYIVRCVLVRRNPGYRHYMVDSVCDRHRTSPDCFSKSHVLHPGSAAKNWYFDDSGERKSICFDVKITNDRLEGVVCLRSLCNDSCPTCEDPAFKTSESGRDLLLVLTLECKTLGMLVARRSVVIWPKAIVREKDIIKPVRRLPKGGLAIQNKKKSEFLQNQMVFLPSPPQTEGTQPTAAKKVNILLQVMEKIPENGMDVLQIVIRNSVSHACSLGLSREEYLLLCSREFDIRSRSQKVEN